jgi:hypothetical protein
MLNLERIAPSGSKKKRRRDAIRGCISTQAQLENRFLGVCGYQIEGTETSTKYARYRNAYQVKAARYG